MQFIRIISVPRGKAPRNIRKQWVGLKLPLARPADAKSIRNKIKGVERFFIVNSSQALSILDASSPQAAIWWRRNLPPVPNNQVAFRREICQLIIE